MKRRVKRKQKKVVAVIFKAKPQVDRLGPDFNMEKPVKTRQNPMYDTMIF